MMQMIKSISFSPCFESARCRIPAPVFECAVRSDLASYRSFRCFLLRQSSEGFLYQSFDPAVRVEKYGRPGGVSSRCLDRTHHKRLLRGHAVLAAEQPARSGHRGASRLCRGLREGLLSSGSLGQRAHS